MKERFRPSLIESAEIRTQIVMIIKPWLYIGCIRLYSKTL